MLKSGLQVDASVVTHFIKLVIYNTFIVMSLLRIQAAILLILFFCGSPNVIAKELMSKSHQITLNSLNAINHKSACEPIPSPQPEPILTDFLFKKSDQAGINKETDWKWLTAISSLDSMISKEGDDFYQMEIDLLKKSKSKKQMLMMKMGKCWINMNGTYGLNETQDKIILTDSSGFDVSYPETCTFGTDGCIKINNRTHRVIAKNKSTPPMTKETITTDYLKPIRDARNTISEKCR